MISTLISLPYEIARLPLKVVDDTVSRRLSETSMPRVALDQALGTADRFAGALLGNRTIADRGADRLERSRLLRTAAELEAEAESARHQAGAALTSGRQQAEEERDEAANRVTTGLREADAAEARGKQEAKVRAEKTASAKKASADNRAETRTGAAEQRKQRVESAAQAKKNAAQGRARSELDDAREARKSASGARADAERLSDLTEAKKQERKGS